MVVVVQVLVRGPSGLRKEVGLPTPDVELVGAREALGSIRKHRGSKLEQHL